MRKRDINFPKTVKYVTSRVNLSEKSSFSKNCTVIGVLVSSAGLNKDNAVRIFMLLFIFLLEW